VRSPCADQAERQALRVERVVGCRRERLLIESQIDPVAAPGECPTPALQVAQKLKVA
jgi:hypothetical protein